MTSLAFYYAPGACSLVSHIALEELGLSFEAHPLAFMAGEHKSPVYMAINPSGKVPTLVVDGLPVVESLAILGWLDGLYPGKLMPESADAMEKAQAWSLISWFASTVHPVFTRFRVPPSAIADPSQFGAIAGHAAPQLAQYFGQISARLAERKWLLGDWSIADAWLFWLWSEAVAGGFDPHSFPLIASHAARVQERPAVKRALAREAEAVAIFEKRGLAMSFPPK